MFLLAFAESIQLFPDGTIFIHIALILLMIWILNRTFFKPINKVIASREKHKAGPGGEADSIMRDVLEKEAKLNQAMLGARSEGYNLIEKERAAAVELRSRKLADAKAEVSAKLAAEKQELEQQADAARTALAAEAEVMAEKISTTVLKP